MFKYYIFLQIIIPTIIKIVIIDLKEAYEADSSLDHDSSKKLIPGLNWPKLWFACTIVKEWWGGGGVIVQC